MGRQCSASGHEPSPLTLWTPHSRMPVASGYFRSLGRHVGGACRRRVSVRCPFDAGSKSMRRGQSLKLGGFCFSRRRGIEVNRSHSAPCFFQSRATAGAASLSAEGPFGSYADVCLAAEGTLARNSNTSGRVISPKETRELRPKPSLAVLRFQEFRVPARVAPKGAHMAIPTTTRALKRLVAAHDWTMK